MVDMFGNDVELSELIWMLIFINKMYVLIMLICMNSEFVN